MGLKKEFATPEGFTVKYANIPVVHIVYYVYKDETARREGKRPAMVRKVEIDFNSLTDEQAQVMYALLKETEDMAGAEDSLANDPAV